MTTTFKAFIRNRWLRLTFANTLTRPFRVPWMKRIFEPTTRGNPQNLTIDQHVFPRSAITRFANGTGRVETQSLRAPSSRMRVPTEKIFCASRAWDQAAETYRTVGYEEPYRKLADAIASGKVASLSAEQHQVVTLFHALWGARSRARHASTEDVQIKAVAPERTLSKEQEETLEAKGVMFMRGTSFPRRFMNGAQIMRWIDDAYDRNRGARWGILHSKRAEFLVPDNTVGLGWIPVTPNIGLAQENGDLDIPDHEVARVNRTALGLVREYYFGRNLANCPR